MAGKQFALTTIDNKYNPFTQFDQWYAYDMEMQYKTCEMLGWFAKTSTESDDDVYDDDVSFAIQKILELNPFGRHYKVYEDEADTLIPLMNKVYEELKAKGEL